MDWLRRRMKNKIATSPDASCNRLRRRAKSPSLTNFDGYHGNNDLTKIQVQKSVHRNDTASRDREERRSTKKQRPQPNRKSTKSNPSSRSQRSKATYTEKWVDGLPPRFLGGSHIFSADEYEDVRVYLERLAFHPSSDPDQDRKPSQNSMVQTQSGHGLCDACKSLNLCLEDFVGATDIGQGSFPAELRSVSLGTFAQVQARKTCSLCRLVVRTEHQELRFAEAQWALGNTPCKRPTDPLHKVQIHLATVDHLWDGDMGRNRIPVILYPSNSSIMTIFAPLAHDVLRSGVATSQYFTRNVSNITKKCALIGQWVKKCESEHRECHLTFNSFNIDESAPDLILIDVKAGCLVRKTCRSRFVALSYVWGKEAFFTLSKSNLEQLFQPHSLWVWRKLLPKTVRDAISVVTIAGERYLWVDSLCIVQDDEQKHEFLGSMHLIYGSAVFVVIALGGEKADSGLFPVSGDAFQISEQISPEFSLASFTIYNNTTDPPWGVASPKYKYLSRGWTYQEHILARRQVVFLDGTAFFRCSAKTWREDLVMENGEQFNPEDLSFSGLFMQMPAPLSFVETGDSSASYKKFSDIFRNYLYRELSYPSDAINAFAGLSSIFANALSTPIMFNTPLAFFDIAILWRAHPNATRNHEFPSWSNPGWHHSEPADCPTGVYGGVPSHFLGCHTWIEWAIIDSTSKETPLWHILGKKHKVKYSNMAEAYLGYLRSMSYRQRHEDTHALERDLDDYSRPDDVESGSRTAIQGLVPYIQASQKRSTKVESCSLHRPGMLKFSSLSVVFNVSLCTSPQLEIADLEMEDHYLVLLDVSGFAVGQLHAKDGDTEEYLRASCNQLIGRQKFILVSERVRDKKCSFESKNCYITELSEYRGKRTGFSRPKKLGPLSRDARDIYSSRNEPGYSWALNTDEYEFRRKAAGMDRWDRYSILMVAQQESNVYHRLASGWMYRECIANSLPPGPQWEEFLLA